MENLQMRHVLIPKEKIGFFKRNWFKIYTPIVEISELELRMNLKTSSIDLRTCLHTKDRANLERAATFIDCILKGFPIEEAIDALKSDMFTFSFSVADVKFLKGDHVDRAIGRVIGRKGSMKKTIERVLKIKILIIESTVYLLGHDENIRIAKDIICRLIMGSEPSKISNRLRILSGKLKEKYGSVETVYNNLNI